MPSHSELSESKTVPKTVRGLTLFKHYSRYQTRRLKKVLKIKISEVDLNAKTNNTNLCCSLVLIFSLRCSWKKKNCFLWYFPIFPVSLIPKRPCFNILNLTHILKWIALHRYHQINCAKPNYAKNWNNTLP